MGGIVVALTIGFLLGILLMILLVSGRDEEKLVGRIEEVEASRRLPVNEPEQAPESVKQARNAGRSGSG